MSRIFSLPLIFLALVFTNASANLLRRVSEIMSGSDAVPRELGGSSICNSLPYIDNKTAPKGAKLQLYGVCDEVVVQDLGATTGGYFMSGLCHIYNSTSLLSSIGTLRFTLDASFDSNYLIQTISVMRLFDQIVLTSSASSYPNSNGPYLQSPTTFGISNVVVDEGLAYTGLTDCGFSKYKKIVYTSADDITAIFTFF